MKRPIVNSPFAKGLPSLFVVGTPFQALCAVEAILDLEISEYKLYAVTNRNNRDDQMFAVLDYFHLTYEAVDKYTDIYPYFKRLLIITSRENKFKRAFVGSYRSVHFYYWAMRNISNKSIIISLDDGNQTVSIFKNLITNFEKNVNSFLNYTLLWFAAKRRRIVIRKYFYTIYSDIENKKFICYPNFFSHIFTQPKTLNHDGVYFVGTALRPYCKAVCISEEQYYLLLHNIFENICTEFPNESIYYIPHGRDMDGKTVEICQQYGLLYKRPSSTIELFMCSLDTMPKTVIGFTSSALFNIVKIFETTDVRNILVESKGGINDKYRECSTYYSQHRISTIVVRI